MFCQILLTRLLISLKMQNIQPKERSVGLGVMGFHSYLQKNRIPLESVIKAWNKKIFKTFMRKLISVKI